jgi:hypothetical protein
MPMLAALVVATSVPSFKGKRPGPPPISAATLDKIHAGLPRAEVEAFLGGPPGDYGRGGAVYDGSVVITPRGQPDSAEYSFEGTEQWRGDRMVIAVRFDRAGRVESAFGLPLAPTSWRRSLQRWLALPWPR